MLKWEYLEHCFCSLQRNWNKGSLNATVVPLMFGLDAATERVGLRLRRDLVLIGCYSSHPVFDVTLTTRLEHAGWTRAAISCTRPPLLGWHGDDWHSADSPEGLPANSAKSPDECYCKIGPPPYLETSALRFKTNPSPKRSTVNIFMSCGGAFCCV